MDFETQDTELLSDASLPPSLCMRCWDCDATTARPGGGRSLHFGLQQAKIAVANTGCTTVTGTPSASSMAARLHKPQEMESQQHIGRRCEAPRKSQWQRRALGLSARPGKKEQGLDSSNPDPSRQKSNVLSNSEEAGDSARTQKSQNAPRSVPNSQTRYSPYSAEWIIARLRDSPSRAIPLLRIWSHNRRFREINSVTVRQLNDLPMDKAVQAVKELKEPRIFVRGSRGSKLTMQSTILTLDTREENTAEVLLDSGCEGSCIDIKYVRDHGLSTTPLPRPIPVYNADGQLNVDGPISEMITLQLRIDNHIERIDLGVTNLGKGQIFLGHDWLKRHNPSIDWRKGIVTFNRCPPVCTPGLRPIFSDPDSDLPDALPTSELEVGDRILMVDASEEVNIRAYASKATQLAEQAMKSSPKRSFEEMVPAYLHDFHTVFEKKDFDELPPSRPWDHAIELIPGVEPRLDCKIYPLSRDEQDQLDSFITEHLRTGRIRPSKSPMASPFFFVKKKDGSLRPIQDYRKLNELTIKNRYPLPLISDLIDTLQNARYFTKLDVRWGYNNIRIKRGDEYKAAFRTNRGLFEPLVMFFGLTNSPATFQTMMNDIFRDEISQGHVLVYLDDILIFSKDLHEHHRQVHNVLQ